MVGCGLHLVVKMKKITVWLAGEPIATMPFTCSKTLKIIYSLGLFYIF